MRPGAERLGRSRILLVDDDLPLLRRISSYLSLELGLEVETAPNGSRALEMLQARSYRFLLTDIRMPGMPWFDLVQFVRENRPETRYALLTGFEVDNFLQYALEYDVGTILSKDSPHLLEEIGDAIEALLTEDVFGLEKWLGPGAEVHARQIRRAEEIPDVARAVASWFAADGFDRIFRRVLQEVLTNAVYYGSLGEDGDRKPEWETELVLARDQVVYVFFGRSETHVGCSVVDRGGRLSKTEILRWLVRNTTRNADGLMLSTDFTHGRGLHITRRSLERVIFNTRRSDRTEVILLQGTVANSQKGRPLLIHEF